MKVAADLLGTPRLPPSTTSPSLAELNAVKEDYQTKIDSWTGIITTALGRIKKVHQEYQQVIHSDNAESAYHWKQRYEQAMQHATQYQRENVVANEELAKTHALLDKTRQELFRTGQDLSDLRKQLCETRQIREKLSNEAAYMRKREQAAAEEINILTSNFRSHTDTTRFNPHEALKDLRATLEAESSSKSRITCVLESLLYRLRELKQDAMVIAAIRSK
jgi:hypothetical protein